MLDAATAQRLGMMFDEKAKALGLKYKLLVVTDEDRQVVPGIDDVWGEFFLDWKDGNVTIRALDISRSSPEDLEMTMEHEACHCMDYQEGIYRVEVSLFTEDPYMKSMAVEMDYTHGDYFASKRQIAEFGAERFRKFHMKGMEEFVERAEMVITRHPLPIQRALAVFAQFKEQVKSSLIGGSSGLIPEVVAQLAAPLPECFEMIRKTGLDWITKSNILYVLSDCIGTNIDLPKSYMDGAIVPVKNQQDISLILAEQELIDGKTFSACSKVEDFLRNSYGL